MSGIQVVVWYSDHHLNNGPVGDLTTFDHLNTRLVRDSDPRCICRGSEYRASLSGVQITDKCLGNKLPGTCNLNNRLNFPVFSCLYDLNTGHVGYSGHCLNNDQTCLIFRELKICYS